MANVANEQSAEQSAGTPGFVARREHEAAFLVLGLAQFVSIFGLWLGFYPGAFNLTGRSALSTGLAIFFLGAGTIGFYLAFVYLTLE